MSKLPKFTSPDAWAHAHGYVREANRPDVVEIDGHPWKLYPSGRVLCAATKPYHKPLLSDGCDCLTREGETIVAFTMPL